MAKRARRTAAASPTITVGDMLRVLATTLKTLNGIRAVLETMGASTVLIKGTAARGSKAVRATGEAGKIVIGPVRIIAPHCQPPDMITVPGTGGRRKAAKK